MDTIVRVKWCRARFIPGESPIEECRDEEYDEWEDVGYLISKDANKVIIAHEKIANDYCDVNVIPIGCVLNLAYLQEGNSPASASM